jgi:HEAT repeats
MRFFSKTNNLDTAKPAIIAIGLFGFVMVGLLLLVSWRHEPSFEGKPLGFWLQYMDSLSSRDHREANKALLKMGPAALPAVLKKVITKDPTWKTKLIALMRKQSLIKIKFHSWNDQRHLAAQAFRAFGPMAAPATPTLMNALADPDPSVRESAAQALGGIGPQASPAIPGLTKLLGDGSHAVRREVIYALGAIGPGAVPSLLAIIREGNSPIQHDALAALSDVLDNVFGQSTGIDTTDVVPVLVEKLNDQDARIRQRACGLLGHCGAKARDAVPALQKAAEDQDKGVRGAATLALFEVGHVKTLLLPATTPGLLPMNQTRGTR